MLRTHIRIDHGETCALPINSTHHNEVSCTNINYLLHASSPQLLTHLLTTQEQLPGLLLLHDARTKI